MKIIIPMAGWGTRLRPHTLTVPKPLVKVAGKPIVERLVEKISESLPGREHEIVFVIKPEFGSAVEENLREIAGRLGMKSYIRYQDEALGTAHAVYMAREFLEGPVFIAYADTLYDGDWKTDEESDAVILVKKVDRPEQFGVVTTDEEGHIVSFVEKPRTFVSDLAIIGMYFFKKGEDLLHEIQFLMDHDIKKSGEYQLTDALIRLLKKGMVFRASPIDVWMDFGNKDAVIRSMKYILDAETKQGAKLIHPQARLDNTETVPPVYIAEGVKISGGKIGPYVCIEKNSVLKDVELGDSIVGENSILENLRLENSMIGNHVEIQMPFRSLSIGDYSKFE